MITETLATIVAARIGEDGYPRLAIARANAERRLLEYQRHGGVRFAGSLRVNETHRSKYTDLPPGWQLCRSRSAAVWRSHQPRLKRGAAPRGVHPNPHILRHSWALSAFCGPRDLLALKVAGGG
jgi:hypothetical protein